MGRLIVNGLMCISVVSILLLTSACSNTSAAAPVSDVVIHSDKLLKNVGMVIVHDDKDAYSVEFCHTEEFVESVSYKYDQNCVCFEAVYKGDVKYSIDDLLANLGVIYAKKEFSNWDYEEEDYPYYSVSVSVDNLDGPEFTLDKFKEWAKSCETKVPFDEESGAKVFE